MGSARALFIKNPNHKDENEVNTLAKQGFWRNHSPTTRGPIANNGQASRLLFPLLHKTRITDICNRIPAA